MPTKTQLEHLRTGLLHQLQLLLGNLSFEIGTNAWQRLIHGGKLNLLGYLTEERIYLTRI